MLLESIIRLSRIVSIVAFVVPLIPLPKLINLSSNKNHDFFATKSIFSFFLSKNIPTAATLPLFDPPTQDWGLFLPVEAPSANTFVSIVVPGKR